MKLEQIIGGIDVVETAGDRGVEITSLTLDSRSAEPGGLFFASRGAVSDGHAFIDAAIDRGAVAVMCEEMPAVRKPGVTYVVVRDTAPAMGAAASEFHGNPSRKLKLVGVTGTNGKTTTATLLYDLFKAAGHQSGLISTVEYRVGDTVAPSTHTTPDSLRLNAMLATMVERGCEYCFMEVSSHAVVQERIAGLRFAGGAFTNITHDHLDYHGTFANYIAAKKKFFDGLPKGAFAVTNIDDRNGTVMVQNTPAEVRTVSLRSPADFRCRIVEMHFDGMLIALDGRELWVRFTGRFNAGNLATVYACARMLGMEKDETLRLVSTLSPVSGRFETIASDSGVTAIIDYAHTPDALRNVLETIDGIRKPGQKVYTVAGCGGDRDAAKRPLMARIAASGSDFAILTSDNPRTEDPAEILDQMRAGLEPGQRAITIIDRREAIRAAAAMASPGDIILIAGKGHENYQIIGTEKHHFDDREEIRAAFQTADKIE